MSLQLDDIFVTVPDGTQTRTILDRARLHVDPGEIVALSGASGSGKSTLLAVAALLLRPQSGRVLVDGHDLTDAGDAARTRVRRDRIGVVYQTANLVPSLTARQQLELVAHVRGDLDDRARSRAGELLERVGLSSRADARPADLSGGERQRVGIARALMADPAVIVADEPTAALDAERGRQVMGLLVDQASAAGIATLVVTHLPEQIDATRHVTLQDGIVLDLTHREVA